MSELTPRQRMLRILRREPVDRIGACESFWPDTHRKWSAEGHVGEDESLDEQFGLDLRRCGAFTVAADLDNPETVVEETEQTRLVRNANGALLRWWKNKSGTPEHVDFLVKDRAGWDEHIRPRLTNADDYRRRIAFIGGMDVRSLVANDRDAVRDELEHKLAPAMAGGGYALHSDHSIPDQVEYETYKYFLEPGRQMGTY